MLIFLVGAGSLALYQVKAMEDQLADITQSLDKLDPGVKRAQYEKNKFFTLAREVLRLAPKDPNAAQVAGYFNLHQMQIAAPELMSLNLAPPVPPNTNAASLSLQSVTSFAPVNPFETTNAAPAHSPTPTAR